MHKKYDFYEAYLSDHLDYGHELKLSSSLFFSRENADISKLTDTPLHTLEAMLGDSQFAEQKIFERAAEVVHEWEAAAGQTMLLYRAIEYVKTPAVEHSSNKWTHDRYNYPSVSNAVYKMDYHVYEDTHYNRDTKQSEITGYYLTWSVNTQSPGNQRYGAKIAGQDRKRFIDKATMDKYLQGRIAAYSHLFTEVSPPVPKEHLQYFCVNGKLLPGYTVEGATQEQPTERTAAVKKEAAKKPSLLGQLEANKAEIKAQTTPDKAKKLDKSDIS